MSVRTLAAEALLAGMARCVRESILPALADPHARTQAEVLAVLLDGLPAALDESSRAAARADGDAARAVLAELGEPAKPPPDPSATLADVVADTHALHAALAGLAARTRAAGANQTLERLQRYFLASALAEQATTAEQASDFAKLSAKEDAARRGGGGEASGGGD